MTAPRYNYLIVPLPDCVAGLRLDVAVVEERRQPFADCDLREGYCRRFETSLMIPTLSQDELLLARIMFVNRVLRANGTAFQQLFWSVMRAKHGQAFVEVRPQGRKGDEGNDGFLPADGHYFQVYGPISPEEKVQNAARKLAEDFTKLKRGWGQTSAIRAYSFAFNDKYEATFSNIVKALEEIGSKNPGVKCRPFTAGHLESEFMSLQPAGMHAVLGRDHSRSQPSNQRGLWCIERGHCTYHELSRERIANSVRRPA